MGVFTFDSNSPSTNSKVLIRFTFLPKKILEFKIEELKKKNFKTHTYCKINTFIASLRIY
jgi:hypothetical protein